MHILTSKAPARVATQRAAGSGHVVEPGGGVDVERRVAAGEQVDIVVLAEGAIARLTPESVRPEPQRVVVETEAVVAVAADADLCDPIDVSTPEGLRAAAESARAVGISTGPSGDAVRRILARWGLAERAVTASPGIPVGAMLLDGSVDLAVQQRTELEDMDGVRILGPLPGELALVSRFVGAITTTCPDPDAARAALDLIAQPESL